MPRGLLIALEGLDGSGTTTQAEKLRDWLAGQDRKVHLTGEPSRGPVGSLLRLFVEKRLAMPAGGEEGRALGGATLALLFAADRLDHLAAEILPRIEAGWVVVSDRYVLSSLAYQSGDCDLEFVASLNVLARTPDMTVFLDVPPAVCRRRIDAGRWRRELFEERDVQERVADRYRTLASGRHGAAMNTMIVDGNRTPAAVHADIKRIVGRLLGPSGPASRRRGDANR
jgi:dTMP kinase